jgi:hypothetical protein
VVQSLSAWKLAYHLLTWLISIMRPRYRTIAIFACSWRTPTDAMQEIVK